MSREAQRQKNDLPTHSDFRGTMETTFSQPPPLPRKSSKRGLNRVPTVQTPIAGKLPPTVAYEQDEECRNGMAAAEKAKEGETRFWMSPEGILLHDDKIYAPDSKGIPLRL